MTELTTKTFLLGMDGGGTHTRVLAADLAGNVLAYVEKGGSSIHKDDRARENVQGAILEAVARAGRTLDQAASLTAGMAGYDSESDLPWVRGLTDVEGLSCPRQLVNDAVVAHSGALLSEPGIMVISGTGSIILAVTDDNRHIRNYDLHHYSASAARFLGYDATYEALAGNLDESDADLITGMLDHWGLETLESYSELACAGFIPDTKARNKKFGELAPLITGEAVRGSQLARTVCDRAVHQISVGIKLLGSRFNGETVSVAAAGSVVNSPYFKQKLAEKLNVGNRKTYRWQPPAFSPAAGALLMGYRSLGIPLTEELLDNLRRHPACGC
ncbi:N-acetylglucosamine kinase [Paenibacillus chitinolyticus]|uniref:N-acetylglucosamine kinase n=1 Tax=Paenibacillus chitinolyticus TaxID=79263 RepID=UPI001C47A162|nr:BadF/BadG/BcrA/BcrD ATPase family protein [Paenibacillus chitinolyticus]MBV6713060.1 ATPase [Paenibacillus chitinolyticus]